MLYHLWAGADDVRARLPGHVRRAIEGEARCSVDGRETGGILLGFGGDERGYWVTQAGGPGPAAVRSATRFVRDLAHSEVLAEAAYHLDGSQWIGDWHTHLGGPARLSDIDLGSYRRVLDNSDLDLFLAILALPSATGWRCPRLSCWAVSAERVDPVALCDPLGSNSC